MKKKNLLGALLLVGILVSCNNEGLISGSSSSSAPSTTSSSSSNSSVKGESSSSTSNSESSSSTNGGTDSSSSTSSSSSSSTGGNSSSSSSSSSVGGNSSSSVNSSTSSEGSSSNSSVNSSSSTDGNSSSSSVNSSNGGQSSSSDSSTSSVDSSVDSSSSTEDVVPTDFKGKAKYYYDKLGNNEKLFYTDGNDYMAFDGSDTSHYLGTYNKESNAFSEQDASQFAFGLTNDARHILINKNTLEDPSDDIVYSLFSESGIDADVNSSKYDPYYYVKDDSIYAKNTSSAKMELAKSYQVNYQEEKIPDSILNTIYTLKGEVTIPSTLFGQSIKTIFSIKETSGLTSVTVSEGITKLGDSAFVRDQDLESINLPQSLTSMGSAIFSGCTKLKEITLPGNIGEYTDDCFSGSSITKVTFPSRQCSSFQLISSTSLNNKTIVFLDNSEQKFASLDEAINSNKWVNLVLDVNPTTSDSNTKTYETSIEQVPEGKVVTLPIDEKLKTTVRNLNTAAAKETAYDNTKLYAQLKLNKDLEVSGTIEMAAVVSSTSQPVQGHISGLYTQIDLNGHTLTIKNGGLIECNGKIIDSSSEKSGNIVVENGGTLISNFVVDDFYGGTISAARYLSGIMDCTNMSVTPFNKYRMGYIEPKTKICYGANYKGYSVLYASSEHHSAIQTIVGKDGLFELVGEDSYIEKTVNAQTRNETINIYGDAKNNAMSLETGMMTVDSHLVIFPLPRHYNINIQKGTFTLSTMLKILPGAEVTIEKDATLKLSGYTRDTKHGAKVIIYDEFWDYSEGTKDHFLDTCFGTGHDKHEYPYFDTSIDPTLKAGEKDNPGKLTINGNVTFDSGYLDSEDKISIAGNIYTTDENLESLKAAFEAVKANVSFSMKSKEGSNTGSEMNYTNCFTVNKTSLNIYVGEELKATITNTPAA